MKQFFLIFLILLFYAQPCFPGRKAKTGVKKGNLLYNRAEFEEALKEYEQALLDSPDSDIVNFNTGAALYKTENYGAAISHFEKSLVSENQSLEQKAGYNIGNAKFKYGITKEELNLPEAISLLEQSLHHYQRALELDPEDNHAEYNYEFVKKDLERLREKLRQQAQAQKEKEQKGQESGVQQQQSGSQQTGSGQAKTDEGAAEEKEAESESTEKTDEKTQAQQQPQAMQPGREETEEGERAQEAGLQDEIGGEEKEGQASGQTTESDKQQGEISRQEALMLLENYRQEEEPRGLYKEKIPTRGLPEVLKDW